MSKTPAEQPDKIADYPQITPCEHMEGLVSALSDDSLHGIALWYTKFHVSTCPKCTAALAALRSLRARLVGLARLTRVPQVLGLAPDRRARMEETFAQIEAGHRGLPPG